MKDKQRLKILNEFANDLSVVKGGNIKVTITDHQTSFTPKDGIMGMKYEDGEFLSNILMGASHLLFYLARKGYMVKK